MSVRALSLRWLGFQKNIPMCSLNGLEVIRERGLFLMGIWIRFRPRMEMKERMAPILEWWRTMRFMEEALLI